MKIKAIVMALLVSGGLSLTNADTLPEFHVDNVDNVDTTEYDLYEKKLINEWDLSLRENQRKLVAVVLDDLKSIVALTNRQEQLINEVNLLQQEIVQLRQQLHKQNHAKK